MKIIPTASIVVISLLLGACNQDKRQISWWEGEKERVELNQQVELAKYRLERFLGSEFEDLQKQRSAVEKMANLRKSLESKKILITAEVDSLRAEYNQFHDTMIQNQRQKALGKSFDKLVLASGRSFENVSVSAINDSGVTIRHTDGSARLRFEDLNVQQRWLFGLDEDRAIAAHEKEAQSVAEYENWVDARLASNMALKKQQEENARLEEITASRARADLLASRAVSTNVSPFTRSSSFSDSGYYRSYRSRPTYYSTSYNYCAPAVRRCYYPSQGTLRVGAGRGAREANTLSGRPYTNTFVP